MRTTGIVLAFGAALAFAASTAAAAEPLNGQSENQRDDLGYYYIISAGQFPTGTTPNGDNGSGGTMRYLVDSPDWGNYPLGVWNKDDWFPQHSGFALTLKQNGTTVYDNNGIENGSGAAFYNGTGVAQSANVPGLYRGYSMSNNWDWIYAGYFKLDQATTFDTILGYYDENAGFDSNSPLVNFDMNIWSATETTPGTWMPAATSFTGDVFSAKSTAGQFSTSYSGVDRIFGDDNGNAHDQIMRLTYTLDAPVTLPAGTYFFSHDAEVVPEPASFALLLVAAMAGAVMWRRRR